MSDEPRDEILVVAAQAGDKQAWEQLCRRHAPRLAAYLGCRLRRPAVVDRLVAEVIVGGWKHLHELPNAKDFPAWFRKVGGNLTMQWSRRHPDEPQTEPFPADRCGGDPALLKRMERLEQALGGLPDAQRMALEQRFRGDMDIVALSEALKLTPAGVEQVLVEAFAALDQALGPDDEPAA